MHYQISQYKIQTLTNSGIKHNHLIWGNLELITLAAKIALKYQLLATLMAGIHSYCLMWVLQ